MYYLPTDEASTDEFPTATMTDHLPWVNVSLGSCTLPPQISPGIFDTSWKLSCFRHHAFPYCICLRCALLNPFPILLSLRLPQVILIGATNRPDTIDPALRRPGRFDRELLFTLPNAQARQDILHIHTRGWHPRPCASMYRKLAASTVGYCGADLKALCVEAPLRALRRTFPQIYYSPDRLVIDINKVSVSLGDWEKAIADITPATNRSLCIGNSMPLPPHWGGCLGPRCVSLLDSQACAPQRMWVCETGDRNHE